MSSMSQDLSFFHELIVVILPDNHSLGGTLIVHYNPLESLQISLQNPSLSGAACN